MVAIVEKQHKMRGRAIIPLGSIHPDRDERAFPEHKKPGESLIDVVVRKGSALFDAYELTGAIDSEKSLKIGQASTPTSYTTTYPCRYVHQEFNDQLTAQGAHMAE